MTRRGPLIWLCAVAACAAASVALAVVPAADAGAPSLTWQQAAARVRTPVFRPRVTLDIRPQTIAVNQGGCVIGAWGRTKGPQFSIDEPGVTSECGQPGEANQVATITVNSRKVHILVQCRHLPHCTIHDGSTDGVFIAFVPEPVGKNFTIQLESSHITLHDFVRIAKSFVRVTAPHPAAARSAASPRVRHLSEFLSPDGEVWCGAGATTFCATGGSPSDPVGGPQTLAKVAASGKVTLCRVAHTSESSVCVQNWDDQAPTLAVGQSTESDNILCISTIHGIKCTIASGPAKGRGFAINPALLVRVGPSGPPPGAVPVLGDAMGGVQGFGTAHPSALALGNDITGHMTKIHWTHWGAAQATGSGTGYWVPSGKPLSDARPAPGKILAYDLGKCHGVRAYLRYKWWLPTHGGTQHAAFANHSCL